MSEKNDEITKKSSTTKLTPFKSCFKYIRNYVVLQCFQKKHTSEF